MKEIKDRERFIERRAQGKSLRTIAKEIGVSRPTLAEWEREHEEEIQNRRAMELDALAEKYWMMTQGRIELFGESLRQVREELERRDLSDVPTVKLLDLKLKLISELKKEFPTPNIMNEEEKEQATLRRLAMASGSNAYDPYTEGDVPLFASEQYDNG